MLWANHQAIVREENASPQRRHLCTPTNCYTPLRSHTQVLSTRQKLVVLVSAYSASLVYANYTDGCTRIGIQCLTRVR